MYMLSSAAGGIQGNCLKQRGGCNLAESCVTRAISITEKWPSICADDEQWGPRTLGAENLGQTPISQG
jgi:hypothetical protein